MNFQILGFHLSEYPILNVTLNICMVIMIVCLICCVYRLIKGPTIADRIISGDAVTCVVMVAVVLYGIMQNTDMFMPAALVTALLGFIGMVAMSKYIAGGEIVYPMDEPSENENEEQEKGGEL